MDGDTHQRIHFGAAIFGVLGLLTVSEFSLWKIVPAIVLFLAFSKAPDIDQRIGFLNHRGFSHTFWAGLIPAGIVYYTIESVFGTPELALFYGGTVWVSYSFHIVQDMFTKGGGFVIRPLWPLYSKNMSFGWFVYDHPIFTVVSWVLLLVGIIVAIDFTGLIDIGVINYTRELLSTIPRV